MKFRLFVLFLNLCMCKIQSQNSIDTIPFFLNKQSNICVKAQINDKDSVVLMFHSASTGLTLLKEVIGKKVHLTTDKSSEVQTWGGKAKADFSEGHRFSIGKMHWDSLTIYFNENSGADTDGKFGFDFFNGQILEVDYDNKRMIVYPKLPKKAKKYTKTSLKIKQGTIYIPAALHLKDKIYQDTFMFHTGYGGSVLLDPNIGDRFGMQKALPTISTSELRDSYNNIIKIETKELPEIVVGGQSVKNIPLSFAAQSSNIPMKVLGNDLLKRFNLLFDFSKNELYIHKNGLYKTAFSVKK